ncbi:pimeloyl-ACP methyl ester carboxylesterase [Duganella sp. 1224]|uniref:alpha/beta fold hydrolase n=1 Tax=Duganella sp. 1224 TaxID=2587052 RepID=UPI0015C89E5F|nr:alpha/beta hydrolase [Duganella sp. 1224]NYE63635.1 pimeloyl-ACP methyl ester carboxylesterase [Duganella sp. 1224]
MHIKERGGDGPALVFLHYWGGSSRTWTEVISALPADYHTIAPDLRGWGQSGAREGDAYALADFAGDVEQLVADLGLKRYVLVGHSMGGKIAQLLASRRPPGLAGLVLVAPSPPTPLALPPEARAAMAAAYDTPASVGMAIDHMLTAKPLTAAQREQVVADSLRGTPEARAAWPAHTSREDISAEVQRIAVPTMVVAGELDKVDPVAVLAAELLPRIPQATLYVLPGCGHLSPLEAPQALATVIRNFVAALPPA